MITAAATRIANLRLLGRSECASPQEREALPLFWAGSGVEFNFAGTEIDMVFDAAFAHIEPWIAVELNGAPILRMPLARGVNRVCLFRGMTPGVLKHVRVFKETQPISDDTSHFLALTRLIWDGGDFLPLPKPKYRLEFIGDSLTSGEGVIGARQESDWVSALFSASRTWAKLASDQLGAEFRLISQSGWGIRSGWDNDPRHALPSYYPYVCGVAQGAKSEAFGAAQKHDFAAWQPDAVIINLGTNDVGAMEHPPQIGLDGKLFCQRNTPEDLLRIENAAVSFLSEIHRHNPHSKLVWAYGMLGDPLRPQLENAVARYREAVGDSSAWYLPLPSVTDDTMGSRQHPGYACHQRSADVTVSFLKSFLEQGGTDHE